jgi:hypothetical protein
VLFSTLSLLLSHGYKPSTFELMRKIARTALALVTSLGFFALLVTCLEYSKPQPDYTTHIPIGKLVGYCFGMAIVFGWFIYLPFIGLHTYLLNRYIKTNSTTSVLVGGLLGCMSAVLFSIGYALDDGEWSAASQSLLLKSPIFGLTGCFYRLQPPAHSANWREFSAA